MLNKLITLSDKLDTLGLAKYADFIDNFIKKLAEDFDDWEEPTKVTDYKADPLSTLQELESEELEPETQTIGEGGEIETTPLLTSSDLVGKLKAIFSKIPNPESWSDHEKMKIRNLIEQLEELL